MARGKSGRVVLEIDPDLKRKIYATLESKQETMKEWFVKEAENLVYNEDINIKEVKRNKKGSRKSV